MSEASTACYFGVLVLRPFSTARRTVLFCFAALLLLVIAGLSGLWWYGAGRFAGILDQWVAARRAEGFRIETPAQRIVGFPLHWTAQFASVSMAAPPNGRGVPRWAWQGHAVTVTWSPFDRDAVHLSIRGTNSVDLALDDRLLPILIDSDESVLRLSAVPREMQHVTGEMTRPSVSMAGIDATAQSLKFDVGFDPEAANDHTVVAGTAALDARQFSLTRPGQPEPVITLSGKIDLALMGKPPAGPPAQSAASWRDAGGTIEIRHVEVVSGGVAVSGNATMSLDGEMRPMGAGTANFSGVDEAIDRLVASGQMSDRNVPLAKLALKTLAKPDPAGGPAIVTMPVTAENGSLYVGPVKIAPLEPLRFD
jgi:hypothetical protein